MDRARRYIVSRIPDGLATALRAIAVRLAAAPGNGQAKAKEHSAVLPVDRRIDFEMAFREGWNAEACTRAANEIAATLDAWQAPLPRARRRR